MNRPTRRRVMALAAAALTLGLAAGSPAGAADVTAADVPTVPGDVPTEVTVTTTTTLPGPLASIVDSTGVITPASGPTEPTTTTTTTTTAPPAGGTTGPEEKDRGGSAPAATKAAPVAGATDPFASLADIDDPDATPAPGPSFDGLALVHADVVGTDPFLSDYTPSWGFRSTLPVLAALGPNATPEQVAATLKPFPVAGAASYTDDWGAPRFFPTYHPHQGTDIFAAPGTPVIASSDGTVTQMAVGTAIGGTTVHVSAADGTYFYYAHLSGFAPGLTEGQVVTAGTTIGYVGNTGDADGGPTHLHFEVHPQGGPAVPPVPYLDQWLADAMVRAQAASPLGDPQAAFLNAPRAATIPVIPIEPAVNVGPLVPAAAGDASGAVVLMVVAALTLAWRRQRGLVRLAAVSERAASLRT